MDLDVVFLGTAASVPSAGRGLSSMLVRRGGERLLFDCGEGTQRQLMRSVGLSDIDCICITHLHADHTLGLPGMLKTFALRERTTPLRIAGPRGLERFWSDVERLVGRLPYPVDVLQMQDGIAWHGDGYVVEAVPTEHGVPSLGWLLAEDDRPGRFDVAAATALGVQPGRDFGVLQRGGDVTAADGTVVTPAQVVGEDRRGRRVIYTGDTAACSSIRDAARDASLLVHEATFLQQEADRARQTGHATALDAALTAAAANVELLALTHLSTRYRPRELAQEAESVFDRVVVARDFDLIEVPLPERGSPRHVVRGARPRAGEPGTDAAILPAYEHEHQATS